MFQVHQLIYWPIPSIKPAEHAVPSAVVPEPKEGDYVVVAYERTWYPGVVMKEGNGELEISFLRRKGTGFVWPSRPDRQTVERAYVIPCTLDLSSENNRLFNIHNTSEIDTLYQEFMAD